MVRHHHVQLLLLVCLAGLSASEREQEPGSEATQSGPSSVFITGVDTVTVGVPYGFLCSAYCSPGCTFTWTQGDLSYQGHEFTLKLKEQVPPQNLTCRALNPATGKTLEVTKRLRVTVGPSNIKISGPPMLTIGANSTFSCTADCFPSCLFTWTIQWENENLFTTQGSTTSIMPPKTANTETLICQAQDSVSLLYITTSMQVWVARLVEIHITGQSEVTVGKQYVYTCFVDCTPSCNYTWTFEGKKYHSDQILLPVFHKGQEPEVRSDQAIIITEYHRSEPLTCEAQNTASGATISTTKILTVTDPISVRPVGQSEPVAGHAFSLQCVGAQNPGSIRWLKNDLPLTASPRLQLSPHSTTLTFRPVLQSDTGSYQCVVSEGGGSIKSIGYQTNVNYGPLQVTIYVTNEGPVAREMFLYPGTNVSLDCLSHCYPACSVIWYYDGKLLSRNVSITFTPPDPPKQAELICEAFNPVTKKNSTAETMIHIPDGPVGTTLSYPNSLEVGEQATVTCWAACFPSCTYTWNVLGDTMKGSVISITPSRPAANETITCMATNTKTGQTQSVSVTLPLTDPLSVRVVGQSQPVAGHAFSLQCVGSHNPNSITWLRNGLPMNTSTRFQLSPHNTTLMFSPILQSDTGTYQCVVSEGVDSIKSIGYKLNVNYGPLQVAIYLGKVVMDGELTLNPGSSIPLECLSHCYPACSVIWYYDGKLLSRNVSITFTPPVPPNQAELICEAFNPVTKKNSTAETMIHIPDGPDGTTLSYPNSLEVGEQATLTCWAACFPSCTYTWNVLGDTMKGSVISITPSRPAANETITCMATNTKTGQNQSVSVTLPLTDPLSVRAVGQSQPVAGHAFSLQCVGSHNPNSITWLRNGLPMNTSTRFQLSPHNTTLMFSPILQSDTGTYQCVVSEGVDSIKSIGYILNVNYGPLQVAIYLGKVVMDGELTLNPGSSVPLECLSHCYPACSVIWYYDGKLLSRNVSITFTPPDPPNQAELICEAFNSVTKKNSTAETMIHIPDGPVGTTLSYPNSLEVGEQATVTCWAACFPSCTYTWNVLGDTMKGSVISITPSRPAANETITCMATNTKTGQTQSISVTLPLTDPLSVRVVGQSQPVAGHAFSLQCVGSHNPNSITWLRNGLPMNTSTRFQLSPHNTTLMFSPILQSDTGTYQCVVSEGVDSIKSIGYKLNVNYGPLQVTIYVTNEGPVAREMFLYPGTSVSLDCLSHCYPACSVIWYYDGKLLSRNVSITFTPADPPNQAELICEAFNPVTKENSTAGVLITLSDGPSEVSISGPGSLEVGEKATFTCSASCFPSCTYTWSVLGGTITGDVITITGSRSVVNETIACAATNTNTGQTQSISKTLSISDPHWCGC